jgi:pimeloyl-ACP methyl ester carboxylesterase
MFAATYPQRVSHLILFGCFARFTAITDYPFRRSSEELIRRTEHWAQFWGTGVSMEGFLPSRANEADVREQYAKLECLTFSPGALKMMYQYNMEIDVRSVLPVVQVPTLVMHRRADALVAVENGRFVADHIPGAKLIEYGDCKDHLLFAEDWQGLCGDIEEFVNGIPYGSSTGVCRRVGNSALHGHLRFHRSSLEARRPGLAADSRRAR